MEKKILDILKRNLNSADIDTSCSWDNCATWDSLHHLSICFDLEEEFNISIEPEEMGMIRSYYDILDLIRSKY